MPKISVVITAYNASKWIAATLDSVLAQDFIDFEVIVIDDGSTDNTALVVADYGERVRCIYRPNGGQPSARNVGIRAARGEYIAFVDADDLWTKEKLRLQMDLLQKTGLAWVYCDAFAFDDQSGKRLYRFGEVVRQLTGDILESLFFNHFIPSPTPVIRKSVFEHVGYFDEDLQFSEDWNMWLKIAAHYPIGLVSMPLAGYRVHSTSMTGKGDPQIKLQGCLTVVERAVVREPIRLGTLRGQVCAKYYVAFGKAYASMRQTSTARTMFMKAIQCYPANPSAYIFWLSTWLGGTLLHYLHRLKIARRGY